MAICANAAAIPLGKKRLKGHESKEQKRKEKRTHPEKRRKIEARQKRPPAIREKSSEGAEFL